MIKDKIRLPLTKINYQHHQQISPFFAMCVITLIIYIYFFVLCSRWIEAVTLNHKSSYVKYTLFFLARARGFCNKRFEKFKYLLRNVCTRLEEDLILLCKKYKLHLFSLTLNKKKFETWTILNPKTICFSTYKNEEDYDLVLL